MEIPHEGIRIKTYDPKRPIVVQGPIDVQELTEEISVKNYLLRKLHDYLKKIAYRH